MRVKGRLGKKLDLVLTPAEIIRFMKFVRLDPKTGCWLWRGYRDKESGYGKFRLRDKIQWAHRVAVLIFNGALMAAIEANHIREICAHGRKCVCPRHLNRMTKSENVAEGNRARVEPKPRKIAALPKKPDDDVPF